MQNYVSLNVDYVDFNRSGCLGGGGSGNGCGDIEGLGEREKREKREKNDKSGENINIEHIANNQILNELVYKTIVMPFYIPLVDYVISNELFIEIIDNSNKTHIIGEGKLRKYRLNGPPSKYDMFIETENENVYHIKKRGIMMRAKVSGDQYKTIVKMLTSSNGGSAGVGAGISAGAIGHDDNNVHNHSNHSNHNNVVTKKKTGLFSWFACFRAT